MVVKNDCAKNADVACRTDVGTGGGEVAHELGYAIVRDEGCCCLGHRAAQD